MMPAQQAAMNRERRAAKRRPGPDTKAGLLLRLADLKREISAAQHALAQRDDSPHRDEWLRALMARANSIASQGGGVGNQLVDYALRRLPEC